MSSSESEKAALRDFFFGLPLGNALLVAFAFGAAFFLAATGFASAQVN